MVIHGCWQNIQIIVLAQIYFLQEDLKMKKIENTVIGLILIIIGVIIGLNAFHITNIDVFELFFC